MPSRKPTPSARHWRALAAAAAVAASAAPAVARAQLERDWTQAFVSNGGSSTVWSAGEDSFSPCEGPEDGTPDAFSVSCAFGRVGRVVGGGGLGAMQMRSSAAAGGALHAYSRVGIPSTPVDIGAHARSYAYYYDPIFFSGYVPEYLRVTAVLHGNAIASQYPCNPPSCGGSNGGGQDPPPDAAYGELQVVGGDWGRSIRSYADSPAEQTVTWDFPVSLVGASGSAGGYFHFSVSLIAESFAVPGTFAVADFGNTAWISSLRAVSADGCDLADAGCDVTALVQAGGVRTGSGATYGGFAAAGPVTTAPEPASIALVGAGLAAGALLRRRRAARA